MQPVRMETEANRIARVIGRLMEPANKPIFTYSRTENLTTVDISIRRVLTFLLGVGEFVQMLRGQSVAVSILEAIF